MSGSSHADTPPLGLRTAEAPEEEGPIIIEPSRGWMWAAIAASVVALGAAGVLFSALVLSEGEESVLRLLPQVTDLPWQQARAQLEEAGFVPIHQGVPRSEGADGTVFEQDPPAGSEVEAGSFVEVFYVIATEAPDALSAPPVPMAGVPDSVTATGGPSTVPPPTPSPMPSATQPTPESVEVAAPLDPPWIAIVASPDTQDDARAMYERRYAADYPDGGVLFSSDFSQMRAGYWVVYLDTFSTRADAQRFCRDTFGTPPSGRQPDCYVRTTAG